MPFTRSPMEVCAETYICKETRTLRTGVFLNGVELDRTPGFIYDATEELFQSENCERRQNGLDLVGRGQRYN